MINKCIEYIEFIKKLSISRDDLLSEEIKEVEELLYNENFKIAVIGEFSVGKSTFLNSIIGKRVLYSSAQEATGVITSIINSNKKCAQIINEDNSIKEIDICNENSYLELKDYLDKNKKSSDVKAININYPLDGFDKEVILLDTPGLQGLEKKELLITKEAIKSANATIMVINNKGLSQTELQLLLGELNEFGKIKTKEIILVINKIGGLYKNRTIEEAQIKINEVVNNVKKTLKDNNLDNIKVFALDSRDYLWAKDKQLYNEVLEKNNSNITKILSQEEYLNRSNFTPFKDYIHSFLAFDNRTKAFYEDINEKLLILLDEFKEQIQASENDGYSKIEELLERIDSQRDLILENRRAMINSTMRQLHTSVIDFREFLNSDINIEIKKCQKEILNCINKEVKDFENLNDFTKDKLLKEVKKIFKNQSKIYIENIYDYQNNISAILKNDFDKTFNKVFKKQSKILFNINKQDINIDIDLKFKNNIKDDNIKNLKSDIKDREEMLSEKQGEVSRYKLDYHKEIKEIETRIKLEKSNMDNEIKAKGPKPSPRQKYKTVTRERKKWLFFKETYEVEVEDGLDYSPIEKWEKSCNSIREKYRKIEHKLNNDIDNILLEKRKREKENDEIESLKLEIEDLKLSLSRAENKLKKLIEEKREGFLAKKKDELYIEFSNLLRKYFNELKLKLNNESNRINENIGKDVKEQIEKYLININKELDEKYSEVKKRIEGIVSINDNTLQEIETIRESIITED